jgi:transcriptional regulator GlxA family with amidase domain
MAVNGESEMLTFTAQGRFEDVSGKFDSVLLVGVGSRSARGLGSILLAEEGRSHGAAFAAVCEGSFLLAEAGLLNGTRAISHWKFGRELAERYP